MKTYCIVTGSNSGIGKEVVLGLVAQGMHVVLACRSEIRAAEAIEQISKELENESDIGSLEFIPLDLNDLDSVRAFAESYLRKGYPLHVNFLR